MDSTPAPMISARLRVSVALQWRGPSPLPHPARASFGRLPVFPPGRLTELPLGQTVPCLLIPPANRIAFSRRTPGCSGQAEMPYCLGVSPPR